MVAGSIWSLLSYTVPSKQTSVAYGMIQAFQHVGIIFATLVSGFLVDSASDVRVGYFYSELFFMATLMVSLFLCVFFVLVYRHFLKSTIIFILGLFIKKKMEEIKSHHFFWGWGYFGLFLIGNLHSRKCLFTVQARSPCIQKKTVKNLEAHIKNQFHN